MAADPDDPGRAEIRCDRREQRQAIVVDTTVMEKNIAYPTDARLHERARGQLAQEAGVDLRQSHARLPPRFALQVGAMPMPSSSSACARH